MMAGDALTGLRVLIVEDEALVSMLIEDFLEELGCEVVGVASRLEDAMDNARTLVLDVAHNPDAAHQLVHDEAVDLLALRLLRPHIPEAAGRQFLRIDLAVDEPARAGETDALEAARERLVADGIGDVQPRDR